MSTGKNKSWKHAFRCEHCGKMSAGRKDGANRFCCPEHQNEFQVGKWFSCSRCLASVGFGAKTAARILGIVHSTNINRTWKKNGIESIRPQSGSWKHEGSKTARSIPPSWEDVYAEYWMQETDPNSIERSFPDWSSIITKERNLERVRITSKEKYRGMDLQQRRERNASLIARAIERMGEYEYKRKKAANLATWKKRNPERHREGQKMALRRMRKNNVGFRCVCNLRNRFKDIMRSVTNGGTDHFSGLIGCTSKQLAGHLESRFKRGMTWANYGTKWHVDHILPCASFDHADPKQRAQCWHWTNLQPLEAKRNMDKKDMITEPQMSLLLCATH